MTPYDFDQIINRRGTYSTQWDYIQDRFGEKDLLPFSISDTDFQVPEPVTRILEEVVSRKIFGYSRWNHDDFKQAITGWYQSRFTVDISPDWILYSPAVCYSLSLMIQLKSQPGDEVVVFSPMYDAFYQVVQRNERILSESPLSCNVSADGNYLFTIDFDDLEARLGTARILLLTNPHNPTGRVFTRPELQQIVQLCEKYQVFLISDDIHMDIVYPGHRYLPVLDVTTNPEQCCILTSASKTMNTPGLIGSYLIVPDSKLQEQFLNLLKGRDALSSVSIPGMYATMAAYREAADYVDQLTGYLNGNMRLIDSYIAEHIPDIQFTRPEGTYLAWIRTAGLGLSDEEIQQKLIGIGKVGIMPGKTYKMSGFLRMNAGCPRSKLIEGLNRLKLSLKK